MTSYNPGGSSKITPRAAGHTEFDILKASHKFLREDDEDQSALTWEDKVAHKYYSSLYREYAVCDLKHYKSGNFALRWRTEEEVVSGAGETTCGNTRCPLHSSRNMDPDDPQCALKTLELPFSYLEDGDAKFALVKVVLCDRCCKKLLWKRNKEKEKSGGKGTSGGGGKEEREDTEDTRGGDDGRTEVKAESERAEGLEASAKASKGEDAPRRGHSPERDDTGRRHHHRPRHRDDEQTRRHRHRSSRSRSPRRSLPAATDGHAESSHPRRGSSSRSREPTANAKVPRGRSMLW